MMQNAEWWSSEPGTALMAWPFSPVAYQAAAAIGALQAHLGRRGQGRDEAQRC